MVNRKMGIQNNFVLVLVVLISLAGVWYECAAAAPLHRTSFPQGFLFGSTTSAYQHEGAAHEGGRKPSMWDTFSEEHPENILDGSNGSVAADQYHRYKEDVTIMKDIGLDAYRFSISWPRLLPRGNLKGGVNQEGIAYYNNLINELIAKGIRPFVTLFHWDVPQALEDQYGGFLSPQIVKDYVDYVDLCYEKFGDRVKMWFTINEPQVFTQFGYDVGIFAPGRCSTCYAGDSATEPYIVGHNLLLAHAAAVRLYRHKYQTSQKGQIGIVLATPWIRVTGKKMEDGVALSRAFSFMNDWFLEPLRSGSYPSQMVKLVGKRLPRFTSEQSRMLRGSYDFLGINYYTCYYVKPAPCRTANFSYTTDSCTVTSNANGSTPAGEQREFCPEGLTEILVYTKKKMNNPVIYVTENGASGPNNNNNTLDLNDNFRIDYHEKHLEYLLRAIRKYGVKVKGYFVWSFMDEFEWNRGYTVSYGIVGVDFKNGLRRFAKASAKWFKQILQH